MSQFVKPTIIGHPYTTFGDLPFAIGCISGPSLNLFLDPDIATELSSLPYHSALLPISHLRHAQP